MTIKINWNGKKFWVKVGSKKHEERSAEEMANFLKECGVTSWSWSWGAKKQKKREEDG